MKLHPCCIGLTAGILIGIYILGFTLLSVYGYGYGKEFLEMWIPLHPGYSVSVVGAFIGAGYGFVEGFVWGFIGGHLYNFLSARCNRH